MELNPFRQTNKHEMQTHPWDAAALRDRLFSQEPRLIEAANRLATIIRSVPHDPKYPNVQPRALIVGGFVRDAILGGHPKDIDLEVYGISPQRLEDLLNQLYPNLVNTVGRSFGILKIHLGDDVEFDVSIPRRESQTGPAHTDVQIEGDPGMSIRDAARRRDFTINALAADPLTGEVVDEFGGLQDLAERRLRVTDPERFQDDALRVYRAIQFVGRMGLKVDPTSKALMQRMVAEGKLDHLSRDRVTEELKKLLLKSERPSTGLAFAREIGVIKRYFPELHALVDLEQEPEWHPEGDAWTHTLMVVDQAAKIAKNPDRKFSDLEKLKVIFASLCHDLGKATTTKTIDKRVRSIGHEEAGEAPTRAMCARLTLPDDVVRAAVSIAQEHLKPATFFRDHEKGTMDDRSCANAIRKLLKRIHPTSWRVLIAASEADSRGRGFPDAAIKPYEAGRFFTSFIEKNRLDVEPTKPLVQGRDLLELGMKPGNQMGIIVKKIESLRDEGTISTREEALAEAKRLIS